MIARLPRAAALPSRAVVTTVATALVAALLAALTVGPARAKDYDLDPDRWNGLGYLVTTADEARVKLDVATTVDLGALEPEDVLLVLYPTTPLPVDELLAFVDSGGYLLLADDQGTSAPLMERLGVTRHDAGPTGQLAFWDHQEGFPLLHPAGKHFLFYNVQDVVANYPAALTVPAPSEAVHPILSFDGGREHFAVEVEHGDGKVLVVADPSIFLNDMLRRFYGDKQFAANALRLYCSREPCAARLVPPGATWTGTFDRERARLGGLPKEIEARVAELNEVLAAVSAAAAEPPWSLAIAGVLGAIVLAFAARALSRERVRVAGLVPSLPAQVSSPALDEARGLVAQRAEADFSHLALTLGEHALDRAGRVELEAFARLPNDSPEREVLRGALLRVQAETASLRARQPPVWSADRFLRLHDDVQVLSRHLAEAGRHRRAAERRTT